MGHPSTFVYRAYGLLIASPLELPELLSGSGPPDVVMRYGVVEARARAFDPGGNGFWQDGTVACHERQGTGRFLVRNGEEIVIDRDPAASDDLVRLGLLGPALGLLLMQRGHLLLHASAVRIRGVAVGFLGVHGAGKSTLAASLHQAGHPVISDDILDLGPAPPWQVAPTIPQIKLWDGAARDLGLAPEALPRVHPDFDKWAWRVGEAAVEVPVPLRRLYALGIADEDEVSIGPLPPVVASQWIMANWYGARFGAACFAALDRGRHFEQCVGLADAVPVRRLLRPEVEGGLLSLAERIAAAILDDLEDLPS